MGLLFDLYLWVRNEKKNDEYASLISQILYKQSLNILHRNITGVISLLPLI